MDAIFVIFNLKVIKNNRNTYHNMHFDKKLPKKKYSVHISGYIPTVHNWCPLQINTEHHSQWENHPLQFLGLGKKFNGNLHVMDDQTW